MKHQLIAVVAAAAAIAVPAAHVAADGPVQFTDTQTIVDMNPCTGEVGEVELTFDVKLHEHRNNTVLTVKTTAAGSDGWSGGGSDTIVLSERGRIQTVNLRITHPEDTRFFVVKHVWKFGPNGEPELTRDTFDCRP